MLTALLNGNKIMANDPTWDDRKGEYRTLCNDHAVCRICGEKIVCKFGEINRHHFAHRRNNDCPIDRDSEEHRAGKTILYEFLMSRYGSESYIDLEHYIQELKMSCDIMVEFNDGRKWAVEFYCGAKEQDLRNKIKYYEEHDILTTWIISKQFYIEHVSGRAVRIRIQERLLLAETGIDKLYIGDWYNKIVVRKRKIDLPRDSESWGSIIFLDAENKELNILRALQPGIHHNIYSFGASIKGALYEVIIKSTDKWGIVWYFEQDKELGSKYKVAKKVLKELPDIDRVSFTKPNLDQPKSENKPHKPFIENIDWGTPSTGYENQSGWKDINLPTLKYRCTICQNEFLEGDMSHIPHRNIPEGTCRKCMRKRIY